MQSKFDQRGSTQFQGPEQEISQCALHINHGWKSTRFVGKCAKTAFNKAISNLQCALQGICPVNQNSTHWEAPSLWLSLALLQLYS